MSQYLTGLNLLDPAVKRYNGGTSTFTMDNNGTTNGTLLWVSGVAQVPGTDYNVSGATITTTTAAPAGTNTVVSLQLFETGIVNTVASNAVTTAKINDDAVTLAKMASGTDGNIISYDASGDPVAIATGNDGQVLTSAGAGAQPAFETLTAGFTQPSVTATTSGTSHTISGIPSGTKLIYFLMNGVNFTGHVDLDVTIGDSGGLETADYTNISRELLSGGSLTTTAGGTGSKWEIYNSNSTTDYAIEGIGVITRIDPATNHYQFSYMGARGAGLTIVLNFGDKTLSGELTQISLSGGTFDEGKFNIMYI